MMIIKDPLRFRTAPESTERKRTYVEPNRFGTSYDPDTIKQLGGVKRTVIRIVPGRVEVIEEFE